MYLGCCDHVIVGTDAEHTELLETQLIKDLF